jgi:hypothetical protein
LKQRILTVLRYLKGFFPVTLPIGVTELSSFASNIAQTYGTPDLPSYTEAIARMILQLPSSPDKGKGLFGIARKSPYYFYRCIRMGQAKEVAFQVVEDARKAAVEQMKQDKQAVENKRLAELGLPQQGITSAQQQAAASTEPQIAVFQAQQAANPAIATLINSGSV